MEKLDPYFALIGRILMALIFLGAGFGKIAAGPAETVGLMEAVGLPAILYWPSVIFEVVAGVFILVGYQARITAILLAGFCLITAVTVHMVLMGQLADSNAEMANMQMILMMKNFAMAGGFLMVARFGAGEFSIDNRGSAAV